jgi:hypothetical protein
MSASEHVATVYRTTEGDLRIKVDAPGIAAVSAKIDPSALIHEIAKQAGLVITVSSGRVD